MFRKETGLCNNFKKLENSRDIINMLKIKDNKLRIFLIRE